MRNIFFVDSQQGGCMGGGGGVDREFTAVGKDC